MSLLLFTAAQKKATVACTAVSNQAQNVNGILEKLINGSIVSHQAQATDGTFDLQVQLECTIVAEQAQRFIGSLERWLAATAHASQAQTADGIFDLQVQLECTIASEQAQRSTGSLEKWLAATAHASQAQSSLSAVTMAIFYNLLPTLPETTTLTISYTADKADVPYLNYLYTKLRLDGEPMDKFMQRLLKKLVSEKWADLKVREIIAEHTAASGVLREEIDAWKAL